MRTILLRLVVALGVAFTLLGVAIKAVSADTAVALNDIYAPLVFERPTDIQVAPGDGSGVFVAEQAGKVWRIETKQQPATKTLILDISEKIETRGSEQGLLGIAFDPHFKKSGFIFLNYSEKKTGATIVARLKSSANSTASEALAFDPTSETRLLRVEQPFSNHNGGQIIFGPDGFLYIALGDGGSAGDPKGNGQNRATLLGKILRIDVHKPGAKLPYSIPKDNPLVGNSEGFREEIYAWGLRNPWRMSFDRVTGKLWTADVGQNTREEVDTIESGKNYGWNKMEGMQCFPPSQRTCNKEGLTLPVIDYGRSEGVSVTGGFVYRGKNIPALVGKYIFSDFGSGTIWALDGSTTPALKSILLASKRNISTFGEIQNGELLVGSYSDGKILLLSAS